MTAREQALLEAFKQRAMEGESALQRILLVTQPDYTHNCNILPLVRGIAEDSMSKALATTEAFCRQFPD